MLFTFLLTLKGPVPEPHLGQFQRSNDEFVFAEFHEDGKHKGHEAFLLAPILGVETHRYTNTNAFALFDYPQYG